MGRPQNTQSIIDALKRQGQKKKDGVKNIERLAKMLWKKAVDEEDLKAAQFITNMIDGKPVERKHVAVDVFQHYPQLENEVDVKKYDEDKIIEVEAH